MPSNQEESEWVKEKPATDRVGAFRVLGLLGRGGNAAILRAQHVRTQEEVALKMLRRVPGPGGLRRFKNEYAVLSRLRHPHILSVSGFGVYQERPYYVMELVDEGRNLRSWVRRYQAPETRIRELLLRCIELADALAYLHDRRLVHRDLKPTNVIVTKNGESKLLDFGIVLDLSRDKQPVKRKRLLGTLAYASPEQSLGLPVGLETDIYSFGVTLFELGCGRKPFKAKDPKQLVNLHVEEQAPHPHRFNPDLPAGLANLILHMMEKDPDRRPHSIREIRRRLVLILRELGYQL